MDQTKLFDALRRFARSMSGDYDLNDVLYRLCDEVADVLDIAGAGIAILGSDGSLSYAAANSDDVTAIERIQEQEQDGPCVAAIRTQTDVIVLDIAARPDWPIYRKEAERLGFRSVAGIPLSVGAEHLGALNLYDREPRPWSEQELDTARLLADMASAYMMHTLLEDSRRRTDRLQVALDSRVLIEQAKGILSADLGVTVEAAFELLRTHSRNNNTSLRVIAEAVVNDGFRPS